MFVHGVAFAYEHYRRREVKISVKKQKSRNGMRDKGGQMKRSGTDRKQKAKVQSSMESSSGHGARGMDETMTRPSSQNVRSRSGRQQKNNEPTTGQEVRKKGQDLGRRRHGGLRTAGQIAQGAAAGAARLDVPVKLDGIYEAEIIGLNHDGEGVGRVHDFTLFVRGALPGERVRVRVLHLKKKYGYAELLEILQESTDRVESPCSLYNECGGCQLQHLSYEGQLRHKRQVVVESLERIGKLKVLPDDGVIVHPTIGMSDPWRYRNKAQVPIGEMEGGLVGGFYARGTHRIIDMDKCLIQHEENDRVVRIVKELGRELGIRAYDEATGEGLLRHVVVKIGYHTGDVMVVLVTNGRKIPHVDAWIEGLREHIPGLRSVCQNVNMQNTNVIFGEETVVLWGDEVIYDTIADIRFAISARSFFQVNPVQTEILYRKALEYARLDGEETVIDAYCGIGTISLFLAQAARQVYGVEIVPEAIDDARRNAELNGMSNVQFAVGRAEEILPQWKQEGITADVIVVDPPRKGCEPSLLETILEMRPARVVYVSCNPATLARDLRILEDGGYRTVEAQPVDMFPHTVHVECVSQIILKEKAGRG